ncbi:hypothetical protein ACI3QN_08960 [Propionibacterium freudenreichii]|uniref:hypothetical protein n=1 Tax=Propionibacterium freudenreichii TaxID=1744 RepID=UPI003854B945
MPIINTTGTWPSQPPTFTSSDGRGIGVATIDPAWGGVAITINWRGSEADAVRVFRDGTPVFSGSPALMVGGLIAHVWDGHAPFDADITYDLQILQDSSPIVMVQLAVHTPPMDDRRGDVTICPLADPTAMVWATTNGDQPAQVWDGVSTLGFPPGTSLPGGSWDIPHRATWTLQLVANTKREQKATVAALTQGPVHVRFPPCTDFEDGWCLPTGVSTAKTDAGDFLTSVTMQPITAPSAEGSTLQIPGHTYDLLARSITSFDAVRASVASFTDLLTVEAPIR